MRTQGIGKAAAVACAVGALCALNFLVLLPLLEAGTLDQLAVLVNVAVMMLALPGMIVARPLGLSGPGADLSLYFAVVGVVSSLGWGLLAWVVVRHCAQRRERDATGGVSEGRRWLSRAVGWTLLGAGAGVGGYSVWVEPRWPRLVRYRIALNGLPEPLSGLTAVHLSDLHLGRYNSSAYLERVVRRCNALKVDLVLLTGDFVHGSPRFIPRVARILGGLSSRLGSYAVLGNHDHWEGAELSRRSLGEAGIELVENRCVFVAPGAGVVREVPEEGLCLAGVGDYWEDRVDIVRALRGVPEQMPRLLLSHNPDVAESPQATEGGLRVDLMLSGHTHGGQVALPGVGSLISPSRHGRKYDGGLVDGPRFKVLVSRGVGTAVLPVRLGVRPEIIHITFGSG